MKQIEKIQVWKNGEQLEASLLNATIVNDNLESACTFYYQLLTGGQGTEAMPISVGQSVAEGNISLSGEEYLEWNGSNDYAYDWVAAQLNLTITGDYVAPTTTTTTTAVPETTTTTTTAIVEGAE